MSSGEILKSELRKRGLLYKFVAERTGIPYVSLKSYLNDYRPIPEVKLRCICLTFDIDSKIFGLDDSFKFHDSSNKIRDEREAV